MRLTKSEIINNLRTEEVNFLIYKNLNFHVSEQGYTDFQIRKRINKIKSIRNKEVDFQEDLNFEGKANKDIYVKIYIDIWRADNIEISINLSSNIF